MAIQNRFSALADRSGEWDTLKDADTEVAQEMLGFREYAKHEWISDTTRNLVERNEQPDLSMTRTSTRI